MHVIHARNVCSALPEGVYYLQRQGRVEDSRVGKVLVAPGPVTTVYGRPQERVLFAAVRDANPFFHLAEALWMLAGRDDATFLNNFVRDFGERFAEPPAGGQQELVNGRRVHGAYGRRWRSAMGFDQLDHVVKTLRADPASRQCVVQMWDASVGDAFFRQSNDDLCGTWRDRPCNTHAYLRVREDVEKYIDGEGRFPKLDMAVCCRSNDIIWGAYGANAVHFSVLQEYLAARIGVGVGRYWQVSWNYHAYLAELERLEGRAAPRSLVAALDDDRYNWSSTTNVVAPSPLVEVPETFDEELRRMLASFDKHGGLPDCEMRNRFLEHTAWPVLNAGRYRDLSWANRIGAPDWRLACVEWLERRARG